MLEYEEFIAFILIYASYEDFDFDENEMDFIKKRVGTETFEKAHQLFLSKTEYASLDLILNHKELYFNSPEKKTALLQILQESFQADGDFSKLEKNLLRFFERML